MLAPCVRYTRDRLTFDTGTKGQTVTLPARSMILSMPGGVLDVRGGHQHQVQLGQPNL